MASDPFDAAPDPTLARRAYDRVTAAPGASERLADPQIRRLAAMLLGFSTAAADLLARHPDELDALADVGARGSETLVRELTADADRFGAEGGVRRFRRRALLRTAARDLDGGDVDTIVREISDVADACLGLAAERAEPRLAVVALGKLGGRELNYASDVDVLFVHPEDGPKAQEAGERAAAHLIRLLSEPTHDGIALRVDTALRPGGRSGSLSRSLKATLAYYERGSAVWERQAMLKSRAAAGDLDLGRAFVEGVAPFVYPTHLEPAAIDEVRRTKVRLEEYIRQRGKELTEVKRGRGGIRDVEFAVQLLQIVHGRRDPTLRSPSTLEALAALGSEGYVAEDDAVALAGAYRFLRRLEHRLQIVRDLQTHDLPPDRHARTTIARSLGLADADALRSEYERTTELVRGIHERLFYRPLLEAFAGPTTPRPGVDRPATEELLAGLGFAAPARSYEALERLVDPSTRIGKVLSHLFPVIAPPLALAADPDAALVRLERIVEAVGPQPAAADLLASDPSGALGLAHLAAASAFATDLVVARPERLSALFGRPSDAPGELAAVVARIASREISPRETGDALTAVADRVVRDAVDAAAPPLPFAVIGMGKLGARELNVASDLDVLFVYDGEGAEDLAVAAEAAERVLAGIRARGWEPDADLRPEGRSGPLARSVAGFLEYWQRYAELWEFQALLRARFVAGDEALGRRFEGLAEDFAYPPDGLTIDRIVEIRKMRERIERERVRPPEATTFHFKLGKGSLADVQFAVELSLMRHGGAVPEVRTSRTLDAIERLASRNLLEASGAHDLGEAFVFLSDVKNALEIDRRLHVEALPASPGEQTVLARRLGYEAYPRQAFLDDYLRITRRSRRAMERIFVGGAAG